MGYEYRTYLVAYTTKEKREDITIQEEWFETVTISFEEGKMNQIPNEILSEITFRQGKNIEIIIKSCCNI